MRAEPLRRHRALRPIRAVLITAVRRYVSAWTKTLTPTATSPASSPLELRTARLSALHSTLRPSRRRVLLAGTATRRSRWPTAPTAVASTAEQYAKQTWSAQSKHHGRGATALPYRGSLNPRTDRIRSSQYPLGFRICQRRRRSGHVWTVTTGWSPTTSLDASKTILCACKMQVPKVTSSQYSTRERRSYPKTLPLQQVARLGRVPEGRDHSRDHERWNRMETGVGSATTTSKKPTGASLWVKPEVAGLPQSQSTGAAVAPRRTAGHSPAPRSKNGSSPVRADRDRARSASLAGSSTTASSISPVTTTP